MGRRRKDGHRTATGRLSRAFKSEARDTGTPELQVKKLALVNGAADPALSASPAAILFANGHLSRAQLDAADRYRQAYALSFGLPWRRASVLDRDPAGGPVSDERLEAARQQLDEMVALLGPEQKQAIDSLVVSLWLPMWFYSERGIGRALETDQAAERDALVTGLKAIARA